MPVLTKSPDLFRQGIRSIPEYPRTRGSGPICPGKPRPPQVFRSLNRCTVSVSRSLCGTPHIPVRAGCTGLPLRMISGEELRAGALR